MPELTDITIDKEIDARGSFCPGHSWNSFAA